MEDTLIELLQKNRLSKTKARLAVFKALTISQRALSMNELIQACPSIDRVSVYRVVDQFEKVGIISKIQIGWKYKIELGDGFKTHHHHLSCVSCGVSIDIDEPEQFDDYIDVLAQKHSFSITQHTLELRGLCLSCKQKA